MTRLIDADKLEAYGTTVPKECNAEDYLCGAREVLEHIDAMPTVDAIPIEYIQKTSKEWARDGYKESAEALDILVSNWVIEGKEE